MARTSSSSLSWVATCSRRCVWWSRKSMTNVTDHATAENNDSQKAGKPVATSATLDPRTTTATAPTAAEWATIRSKRWRYGLSRVRGGTSVSTDSAYPTLGCRNRWSAPEREQLVGGGQGGDQRERVLKHRVGVLARHAGHRVGRDHHLVAEIQRGERHAEHAEVHRHAGGDDGAYTEIAQDLVERGRREGRHPVEARHHDVAWVLEAVDELGAVRSDVGGGRALFTARLRRHREDLAVLRGARAVGARDDGA